MKMRFCVSLLELEKGYLGKLATCAISRSEMYRSLRYPIVDAQGYRDITGDVGLSLLASMGLGDAFATPLPITGALPREGNCSLTFLSPLLSRRWI